jgi:hypothetical protein
MRRGLRSLERKGEYRMKFIFTVMVVGREIEVGEG